ncbi:MAG: tRNA-dihydrouridine synthase, partial [Acidaminococcaceae bacterium]|nr:tRNA-dihydrouridine synthase [Acidaminococcaceae bacterium]
VVGGLSGPCIRPVGVCMVYQVSQKVHVPIIGMGGIMNAEDAIEFMLAGASAVAVGTANFVEPGITDKIVDGMLDYIDRKGYQNISEIVGLAWK